MSDRYAKIREALEMEVSAMRELPRDLVLILRTEAKNQRMPPIDYVIAEDGGRMVHRPEPDIAMAELLEEAAAALEALSAENERLRKDAERYRALRDGSLDDLAVVRGLGVIDYGLNVVLYTYLKEIEGDEMDNAIDAARRALKEASDERS